VILTAGMTPAWQQILVFDHFRYREVNRAVEAHWCASGKVLNAGIAAHRLGGPSLTLSTAGGPPLAEMSRDFQRLGVPCRWVETQATTRVCTTILDRQTHAMTELVENGRTLSTVEIEAFRQAYAEEVSRADVAVLIGSLPQGVPLSFYRELLLLTPCPAVLDFRGEGLLGLLDLQPMVVKPNREELGQTFGRDLASDDDLRAAMQSLNDRGAQWVIVSQGAKPVWASHQGRFFRVYPPPAERVVNPIGCGDSMTAALAWQLRGGGDMLDGLRLAVAAAGANLRQLFPCRFDADLARELARQVRVEAL